MNLMFIGCVYATHNTNSVFFQQMEKCLPSFVKLDQHVALKI